MDSIMKHITRIFRLSQQYKEEMTKGMEISGYEGQYLICVFYHSGITQDQIAKKLCIDKSNVARKLASLEEKGYITREALPMDKRNLQVFLTEKGKEQLPQVEKISENWNNHLMEGLLPEEREQLVSLMKKVRERAVAWQESGYACTESVTERKEVE